MQPLFGVQIPVAVLQSSLTHWPLFAQVPSPSAMPQSMVFGSQTPDTQTRVPTAVEQVATELGALGRGEPFGIFGTHAPTPPVGALHHWLDVHCES